MASFLEHLQREALSVIQPKDCQQDDQSKESGAQKTDCGRNLTTARENQRNKSSAVNPDTGDETKVTRRRRRRRRRPSSSCSDESKLTVPNGVLFVEFPGQYHGMDLKTHLKRRMGKVPDFSCDPLQATDSSPRTVVKLIFPSKNSAKSASRALKQSNLGQNMLFLNCVFNEMQLTGSKLNQTKALDTLHKIRLSVEARIGKQLEKHDKKIKDAEDRFLSLQVRKHIPLDQYELVTGERKTVESKITELQSQRIEFNNCVEHLILKELNDLEITENFNHKVTQIRLRLGIEMNRLDKAFPIYARRQEIVDTVLNNPVCVVLGETGSGKSTQMPQFLYEAGLANDGLVICTQPRKIAATSLATHVASELITNVGQTVGYKVGMKNKTSAVTKVIYMTDHMLLNEILTDPILSKVSCIVVDEAHERSIFTDLLLGMVKQCMAVRPDLKVVITSATIDPDVFVAFFKGCPIVRVSGRTFPVEVVWHDPTISVPFENHMQTAVQVAANIHEVEPEGDILVFLTSPFETEKCCSFLEEMLQTRNNFKCLQLHGKLQAEEQQAVFEPLHPGIRKIVFATNSAETSVTIPGIKYVVDCGLVKEMQYDPKKSLSSLDTVVISQSSAEQRKGRAGRMSSGKCFRLYTEENYNEMKTSSLPEILRVHLAQALLKLLDLGVDPLVFDFVESPSEAALKKAMESLGDLGAVNRSGITDLGKRLALLPFEPRLGKLLLMGIDCGIAYEAISMAALTTMGSSLFYRAGTDAEKTKSDLKKTRFCHPDGDHVTMMNVYQEWFSVSEKDKSKWCVSNSINGRSMRMVREIANEVVGVLKKELKMQIKVTFQPIEKSRPNLKNIIFEASKQNLAVYLGHPKAGYLAAGPNQKAQIHPSSSITVIGGSRPEWVIFEQLINTSRDFLTSVSPVDRDLVHKAYADGGLKFDPSQVETMKVALMLTKGLGRNSFFQFVGPRFSNLKVLEEHLMTQVETACVDADKKRLQILVHGSGNKADSIREVMDSRLQPILKKMEIADREIPLHEKSASVRAIVGAGGTVSAVLFSGEYRTVFVEEITARIDFQQVEIWLGRYGVITECNQFRQRPKTQPQQWGTVTFKHTASALAAVEDRKEKDVAKVVPCVLPGRVGRTREFTLQLSWTRRLLRGFGFITMVNPEDMCRLIRHSCIEVDGHSAPLSINKKDGASIFVRRLPMSSTEKKVREAAERCLDANADESVIANVALIREKEFETTPDQHARLKRDLQSLLGNLYPKKNLSLDFSQPPPKANYYTAFLRFTDPNEGVEVFNAISKRVMVDGQIVEVQQDLSTDIFVPKYLLSVLQTELDTLDRKFKSASLPGNVFIKARKSKAGHCYIRLQTENHESLATVKRAYDSLLAGQSPDLSEFGLAVKVLFRKEGRDHLAAIEKSTGTIIRADYYKLQIAVIGNSESCEKAIGKIKDYVALLVSYPVKTTSLSSDMGLMKKLLETYGVDLGKFKTQSGIGSVELDYRKQLLTTTGTEESLEKANALIQECRKALKIKSSNVANDEDDSLDCVVCFCPIEEGQLHRLNICGHSYCLDCIKLQVRTNVDKRDLPLRCASQDCDLAWCWTDLDELLVMGGRNLDQLAKAAMDSFISQHKDFYQFCLTPDCPGVFPTSKDGKLFICDGCDLRICTSCNVQYHDGLTCAMYNSEKSNPGLSEWLAKDKANNKLCPKCTTPIQKNGGCQHLTCLGCRIHICWVCMETFTSGSDCYGHLERVHHTFI